jgi:AcrR family transcriptional regulator
VTDRLPLRERKKLSTRHLLIAKSQELFAERGFRATTLEDVADAADVTVRTLLRYFPTKEDLALALQQRAFDRLADNLRTRPPEMTAVDVWERVTREWVARWRLDTTALEYHVFLGTDAGLLGRTLGLIDEYAELLAAHIARDRGTDPANDYAAWLAGEMAIHGLYRLVRLWAADPDGIDPRQAVITTSQAIREIATRPRIPLQARRGGNRATA